MDIIWIIIGVVLVLTGIAGAVIPGIPGPIISFFSLLVLQLKEISPYEESFLVAVGFIAAAVTIIDYIVPIYGTKKFGGSKMGVRGSIIGLLAAIFVLPVLGIVIGPFGLAGIIIGPFAGAYIGELMYGNNRRTAFRAATGSFIGFLSGTLMKLVFSLITAYYFVMELF